MTVKTSTAGQNTRQEDESEDFLSANHESMNIVQNTRTSHRLHPVVVCCQVEASSVAQADQTGGNVVSWKAMGRVRIEEPPRIAADQRTAVSSSELEVSVGNRPERVALRNASKSFST